MRFPSWLDVCIVNFPVFSLVYRNNIWLVGNKVFSLRELKHLQQQLQRKRHTKSEFALLQTSSPLFHLGSNWKYWRIFLVSNSKWLKQLYHCSEREKRKSFSHVHSSFIQRKTRKFQVVFVKQWQRNAPKSACAARAKLLFCCFSVVLVAVAVAVAKAP